MKKKICLSFQVHQPFRLKRYRFFDIGNDHYYFDDFQNEEIFQVATRESFLPANKLLLDLIRSTNGAVKVAFSISGIALEQIEMYSPELIDSFAELADTGCVEFLGETYAHSLASLYESKKEFKEQVRQHSQKVAQMFNQKPLVFRNSELIYDDEIGQILHEMGFKGVITEGAKHLLGWKSPNYLYQSGVTPELGMLLRNSRFSEDISKNFSRYDWSEYPLTADKYASWLANTPEDEEIICIDMSYNTFGQVHPSSTGIFDFLRALPRYLHDEGLEFVTPSEAISILKPKDSLYVPDPISWSEEEKNTLSWLGNILQRESFEKLEEWCERTRLSQDRRIIQDWLYLQTSDHFLYMSTLNSDVKLFSPYDSPYAAFSNYMNVLSDFLLRVEAQYPSTIENEELNALLTTIHNQGDEIMALQKKVDELTKEREKIQNTRAKKK
ncbi:MAG: glycoside hydrolase family 57 protein [Porphyromonas sp.]|nr:glycoside hydrolase family 57 protein [Porphyromonas sp.]